MIINQHCYITQRWSGIHFWLDQARTIGTVLVFSQKSFLDVISSWIFAWRDFFLSPSQARSLEKDLKQLHWNIFILLTTQSAVSKKRLCLLGKFGFIVEFRDLPTLAQEGASEWGGKSLMRYPYPLQSTHHYLSVFSLHKFGNYKRAQIISLSIVYRESLLQHQHASWTSWISTQSLLPGCPWQQNL